MRAQFPLWVNRWRTNRSGQMWRRLTVFDHAGTQGAMGEAAIDALRATAHARGAKGRKRRAVRIRTGAAPTCRFSCVNPQIRYQIKPA